MSHVQYSAAPNLVSHSWCRETEKGPVAESDHCLWQLEAVDGESCLLFCSMRKVGNTGTLKKQVAPTAVPVEF